MRYIVAHPSGEQWCVDDPGEWEVLASFEGELPEFHEIVDGQVVPVVESYRAQKWEQVKALRDEKLKLADTIFGTAQTDIESMVKINGLATMALIAKSAEAPFSETFTMADNSEVTLNADQMIGFGVAVGQHIAAVHGRGRELRDYLQTASLEEIEALDIEEGW